MSAFAAILFALAGIGFIVMTIPDADRRVSVYMPFLYLAGALVLLQALHMARLW